MRYVVFVLFALLQAAFAQTYPFKTVRLVIPFPPWVAPMLWRGRLPKSCQPSWDSL